MVYDSILLSFCPPFVFLLCNQIEDSNSNQRFLRRESCLWVSWNFVICYVVSFFRFGLLLSVVRCRKALKRPLEQSLWYSMEEASITWLMNYTLSRLRFYLTCRSPDNNWLRISRPKRSISATEDHVSFSSMLCTTAIPLRSRPEIG